jgi:hypothetical protein
MEIGSYFLFHIRALLVVPMGCSARVLEQSRVAEKGHEGLAGSFSGVQGAVA